MSTSDQKDSGWLLTRVWLNALEETARDFHGMRPNAFFLRAYDHATANWLSIIETELGIMTDPAESIKEAVENYIESGLKGGLFNDKNEFECEELPSKGIKITVKQCPYQESCRDLLERGFSLKTLTCARLGCFRSAIKILTKTDCSYELLEVKPGVSCLGCIEPM